MNRRKIKILGIYKLFYFVTECHFDLVYTINFQTNVNIYNTKNYLIYEILYRFRLKISKGQNIIYKKFISVIQGNTVFYLCNDMKLKKNGLKIEVWNLITMLVCLFILITLTF